MQTPDLTIVVPVHGRQWTLERVLWHLQAFEGPVIIADSSPSPYANAAQFPWADYRHMPNVPYYQKLKAVYESVQTEFLVDIPDDDFVVLSGLRDCCEHMRANPDVMICGGHIMMFKSAPTGVQLELMHTGANLGIHIAATNNAPEKETVPARLNRLFGNPVDIVHAVMRKPAALVPQSIIARAPELKPIRFWGRIWMFGAAVLGRVSHIDTLFALRAKNERLISGGTYPKELERDVLPRELPTRLGEGGGVLTQFLMEQTGLTYEAARASVQNVLKHIVNPMTMDGYNKAKTTTIPLLEGAIRRQAYDVSKIISLIERFPRAPETAQP